MEVVTNRAGNSYRTVYTVKFPEAVYALHAFQKKSKTGIKTPQREIEIVRARLDEAARRYATEYGAKQAPAKKATARKAPARKGKKP